MGFDISYSPEPPPPPQKMKRRGFVVNNGYQDVELPVGLPGQVLQAAPWTDSGYRWAKSSEAGGTQAVYKLASESRTTTTVLADDSTLKFTTAPNTVYKFKIVVFFNAHLTPDFKYSIAHTGTTSNIVYNAWRVAANTATISAGTTRAATGSTDTVTSAATGNGCVILEGSIEVGATGGVLSFQWAQNTSDVNAATVGRGSYLEFGVIG